MRRIDRELDLPSHTAKKIRDRINQPEYENLKLKEENKELKQKISGLESENQILKDQVSDLQSENESLKQKITEIESGSLGIRRISDENGDRIELAPSSEFITQLTADGVFKPIEPNILIIGDQENYLNDVVTANVTIASLSKSKENVREPDPSILDAELPTPKIYERADGRKEIEMGFVAEES